VKKRIFAFLLAFLVLIGGIGVRPQKAYANAVLAGETVDVFYGLLGSMGVVVGFEKTHAQKQEEVIQFFEGLSTQQKSDFWEWYQSGTWATADTGHSVFTPSLDVDTSWYRSFWSSVVDVASGLFDFDISSHKHTSVGTTVSLNSVSVGGFSDGAYYGFSRSAYSGYVFTFVDSTHVLMHFYNNEPGFESVQDTLYECSVGSVLSVSINYVEDKRGIPIYSGVVNCVNLETGQSFMTRSVYIGIADSLPYSGWVWGSDSYGRSLFGHPQLGSLDFGVAPNVGSLIDCDTWVDNWNNALNDAKTGEKQVGIISGKDWTGLDTVEGVYAPDTGIITGVGAPTVDVPVTGDLTGIAKGLSDILSKLKALPTAIATAVIGKGALNFEGFKNIKLSTVFPFCIPFDLINCVKSFGNIQPVEPKWVVDFSGTPLASAGVIELDLTQFEQWAKIVRYFCYASVVVGLILITRKIIKG